MSWTSVSSSNVDSYHYDEDAQHLHVRFKNGKVYRYHGVSPGSVDLLRGDNSIGRIMRQHIIPNHHSERVHHADHP